MGNTSYSTNTRRMSVNSYAGQSTNEIFTQNVLKVSHESMSPKMLGIREARDSDVHPNTVPIIIALDVTGSMGRIPENIIKDDLTHLMESLIHDAGLPDVSIMFLAIGDLKTDHEPLQVGQFESGDQELQLWLERTYLEGMGGGDSQESYGLAWIVAGKHTALDSWEKRKQKGFLFTIGDEGFHEEYDTTKAFGLPSQAKLSAKAALTLAKEKFEVFHVHANHGNYPDNQYILNQWKNAIGQNLLMANNDKEIITQIVDTIKSRMMGNVVTNPEFEDDSPAPDTNEKPDIML